MWCNILNGMRAAAGISNADVPANNVAGRSPSREPSLPPFPYARDSPSRSKPSPEIIDLSSPIESPKRTSHEARRTDGPRAPTMKRWRSDDEKRLVGDYSVPADAVALPDPSSWMKPSPALRKPGAGMGVQPMDTLNGNLRVGRSKATTYSKEHRARQSMVSSTPRAEWGASRANRPSKMLATPAGNLYTREDHRQSGGATPGKRRKTGHVIHLDDDDNDADEEVLEVSKSARSTPVSTSRERPSSSQSRLSIGSGSTVTGFNPSLPKPRSEFREADSFLKPSQKKRRKPISKPQGLRQSSPFGSGSMGAGPVEAPIREGAIVVNDPNTDRLAITRQTILGDFQQGGVTHTSTEPQQTSHRDSVTRSHHFPMARINESTAAQTAGNRHSAREGIDLRKQHRPAPKRRAFVEDDDDTDELALSDTYQPTRKQKMSPSETRRAANSGLKRSIQDRTSSNGWPLLFARSYECERSAPTMANGRAELVMKPHLEGWRIFAYEQPEGLVRTMFVILPEHFVKVLADATSRIRLEGPRGQDGNTFIFDLQFADEANFRTFRDHHAIPRIPRGKCLEKPEQFMLRLFEMTLKPKNVKVGTSELVHDRIEEPEDPPMQNIGTSKTPLLDELKRATNEPNLQSTGDSATATAASTRPSRSTRSAPTRAVGETPVIEEVQKFSVNIGLGTRWNKPLEYGEGRQRAVVHFDDLPRLDEDECLNDSLIDFYMIYLSKKLQVPSDKVYFFNSFFFTRLTENSGRKSMNYKAVERWTSKIDVFNYDYIVVPINEQYHWYLAIICNVSNIKRKAVVEDFEEDLVQAMEASRKESATLITTNETGDTSPPQVTSSPKPRIEGQKASNAQDVDDDDVNLFEPSLSLVDREDTGVLARPEPGSKEASSTPQSPWVAPVGVAPVVTNTKGIPEGILSQATMSPARSKARRKPAQPKRDPNQPVIIILDSLGGTARSAAVRSLKDWLAAEGETKRAMEVVMKEKGYYPKASQIPMQNNYTDCGVYLLGYVEKFLQNPDEFKDKLLTGSMSAQEDWPELKPKDMRTKMREIIFSCYEQQQSEKKARSTTKTAKSKTPPKRAPGEERTKSESKAPITERPTVESPIREAKHEDIRQSKSEQSVFQVRSPMPPSRSRLASPFEFDAHPTKPTSESSLDAVDKVSDSPPIVRSPVMPVSATPRAERTTRRNSPEVLIPVKTPGSHTSTHNGQAISAARRQEEMRQMGNAPGSMSPTKRRRPEGDVLPAAKRQPTKSPRRRETECKVVPSPLKPHSREGSAPSMPIEIEDSQDLEPNLSRRIQRPQAVSPAQRKLPSTSRRPMQTLRRSPSFEEIPPLSSRNESQRHRERKDLFPGRELENKLDEDDDMRRRNRRSAVPAPSTQQDSLLRAEDVFRDPMDEISQSTDQMQIGWHSDDAVVRETPEPGRRSMKDQDPWVTGDSLRY
ncbi:hypothetical protein BDW02DRAFT_573289 [Decorospora gaudefroyi]|uniref:Ubiquitin-like protease family profile domain-containing protein n=1 Tax=Decorospora gaudefroyi TaxID=184978 RepID=A0A6A5K6W4_9PLEO|nr:hypothetical protein BDW02DRAFT_573289 [Decorospora gaudefroyi]